MRGVRQVFARGLALTLAKKLTLAGDEVWLRFFDSRLYDLQKVTHGRFRRAVSPVLQVGARPQLRQGLPPARGGAVARLGARKRRQVVLYIITHGQCHIPVELVQQLRRDAYLYGVFILPSSTMPLDYLDLLHRPQIVDAETLASRKGRRDRALEIVADAGTRAPQAPTPAPERRP